MDSSSRPELSRLRKAWHNEVSQHHHHFQVIAYPMQIVFLLDLAFELSINAKFDNIRITLSVGCVRVYVGNSKGLLKVVDGPSCSLSFPVDVVFEVAR